MGRHEDLTVHALTTRYQIIGPITATHGARGDTGGDGSNIMHPSIVRAAAWHVAPRGTYYCLFGHHDGTYVRLAYSNSLTSGWVVLAAGTNAQLSTLNTARSDSGGTHVGSPSVVVDDVAQKYYMIAHGDSTALGHDTVIAESIDLESWTWRGSGAALCTTATQYMRQLKIGASWYGVGGNCDLFKSSDASGIATGSYARVADTNAFRTAAAAGLTIRHCAMLLRGTTLVVFFTRVADYCEHIQYATCDTSGDWQTWVLSAPQDVIHPYTAGDGNDCPWVISGASAISARARQFRDPCVFIDSDASIWLAYAQAGEDAIGIVDITAWVAARWP